MRDSLIKNKNACVQRAVWRQSGCLFWDSVVVILNFSARRNVSEPPPERQAARRCRQCGKRSAIGKRKIRLNKMENSVQFDKLENMENYKKVVKMVQRYFLESWLLPCSLRSHRTANPTPKNGLRHFSALPTHHPTILCNLADLDKINNFVVIKTKTRYATL